MCKPSITDLVNHAVNHLQSRGLYAFCSTVIKRIRVTSYESFGIKDKEIIKKKKKKIYVNQTMSTVTLNFCEALELKNNCTFIKYSVLLKRNLNYF